MPALWLIGKLSLRLESVGSFDLLTGRRGLEYLTGGVSDPTEENLGPAAREVPAIAAPLRGRSPAVRPARARLPYRLAGQMERFARGSIDQCRDCIMATLSHKPSTRTRFSFKAAKLHVVGGT